MSTKGMSEAELACVYAALILQDDDIAITGEKIQTILNAANVEVESFWSGLYAKALEGCDVKGLITNVCEGGASMSAPSSGGATIAAPAETKAEEKKDEKKEDKKDAKEDKGSSSESEGGFGGLFDD